MKYAPGIICHVEAHRVDADGNCTLAAATDGYKWTLIRVREPAPIAEVAGTLVGTNFLDW